MAESFLKIPADQVASFQIKKGFHQISPVLTSDGFFIVNASVKSIPNLPSDILKSLSGLVQLDDPIIQKSVSVDVHSTVPVSSPPKVTPKDVAIQPSPK